MKVIHATPHSTNQGLSLIHILSMLQLTGKELWHWCVYAYDLCDCDFILNKLSRNIVFVCFWILKKYYFLYFTYTTEVYMGKVEKKQKMITCQFDIFIHKHWQYSELSTLPTSELDSTPESIAVSYTHLDVYKRQTKHTCHIELDARNINEIITIESVLVLSLIHI